MYRTTPRIAHLFVVLLMALGIAACSMEGSIDEAEVEVTEEPVIEAVTVTPLDASKQGDTKYRLEVAIDEVETEKTPAGFYALAQTKDGENVRVLDDGNGHDSVSGDGIYTAVIPEACVASSADAEASKTAEIGCTFDVVSVGSECGTWGECPDESILGGPTWFCLCITECEFSIG